MPRGDRRRRARSLPAPAGLRRPRSADASARAVRRQGAAADPRAMSAGFAEGHVEAGGRRLRYLEAGRGAALVHLPGPGGLRLTPAHELLARHFRVVLLDVPELDQSAEPVSTTLATAIRRMGAVTFNLMGTSSGSTAALALALEEPQRVSALVLEAPTALGAEAGNGEMAALAMPTLVLLGTADTEVPVAMGRVYK